MEQERGKEREIRREEGKGEREKERREGTLDLGGRRHELKINQ